MSVEAFLDTTATKKIFALTKRIRAVAGGTAASKTISILVWLIDYAQSTKNDKIDVVSESFPHLEMGVMQDFKDIMRAQGYWNDDRWHDTKHIYTFETGSTIRFFSVDTYGKAHGPRRDILYVNEANNLDYKIVDQLITRTRKIVWMDWNPSVEFWFYTDMLPYRDDIDFMGDGGKFPPLTYKDNEALDIETVKEIETHKHNKMWWQVYGLGHLGDVEGKIYSGWRVLDNVPASAKLLRFWLDFGYSHDPASIGAIYKWNNTYVCDELCYQRGMDNEAIATVLLNQPEKALTIADSSEPKSIDDIAAYNVPIIGAVKGPDSVDYGIKTVQGVKIYLTKRSVNTRKEYRMYQWRRDKNGKITTIPQDGFDHSMDGIRYAITSIIKPEKKSTSVTRTKQYVAPGRTVPVHGIESPVEIASVRRSTSVVRRRSW